MHSSSPQPPRPSLGLTWYRAHGLGNDYLVARGDAAWGPYDDIARWTASPLAVQRVCDRHLGLGADGIMVVTTRDEPFALRAFNPDGGEFERSGNGLRIVASYLHRLGWVADEPFQVRIAGDVVTMQVHFADPDTGLYDVSVEMGRATVGPAAVALSPELLATELAALDMVPVSVGNPHAVVWDEGADIDEVGAALAASHAFAKGTNVQVARVLAEGEIAIDIWERGVGRTSASGSSSCAAAVAAVQSGRIAPGPVRVRMAGGTLQVTVDPTLEVLLRGPVQAVTSGELDRGFALSLPGG